MSKVAIIHPWFPQYRAAFFENLILQAAEAGVTVHVFHGSPPPEWGERGDSVAAPYATPLPTRFIRIGKKSLVLKSLKPLKKGGPYDLVVVEQAVRNIETYALFLTGYRKKIAFWGHGRTYTEAVGRGQERLKHWLTLRGKWFFSYTSGGAEAVVKAGFPKERTTIVQNSIDTNQLRETIGKVTADQITEFSRRFDLKGKTALFMGGLDTAKRLPFLLQAAEVCHNSDADFRLLVVGDGSERYLIEAAAQDKTWIQYLGRAHGDLKSLALASAELMMMPGRVGLVAVDSFAAGLPIITTDWPYHAPEFEYLEDGRNSVVTGDSVSDFAAQSVALLRDKDYLSHLREGAHQSSKEYTVEQMVLNFCSGLQAASRVEKTPV